MSDEAFLSRWSRLKRRNAEPHTAEPHAAEADPPPPPEEVPPPPPEGDPVAVADKGGAEEDVLKDLPPVDSLTAESDFTPFLRAEVPEDLHRQALRKLWTSDPVYANDDGLKDYAEDYAALFSGSGVVKTLYRVGNGFLDALEEAEPPEPVASDNPDGKKAGAEGDGPDDDGAADADMPGTA